MAGNAEPVAANFSLPPDVLKLTRQLYNLYWLSGLLFCRRWILQQTMLRCYI